MSAPTNITPANRRGPASGLARVRVALAELRS
jgi:hypothetical protein